MSADSLPIAPARFAEAIKDLSLASLHLKVLELRNSMAHLDYSNEQLRPFAEGTEAALGSTSDPPRAARPDQDCIDAIKENEEVIERMQQRMRMVREEVEKRGFSWTEFQSKEELEAEREAATQAVTNGDTETHANGQPQGGEGPAPRAQAREAHPAWTDGTFQAGTIRNGEARMDGTGPRADLSDEEVRRALQERLRVGQDEDDEDGDVDGGLHL